MLLVKVLRIRPDRPEQPEPVIATCDPAVARVVLRAIRESLQREEVEHGPVTTPRQQQLND